MKWFNPIAVTVGGIVLIILSLIEDDVLPGIGGGLVFGLGIASIAVILGERHRANHKSPPPEG